MDDAILMQTKRAMDTLCKVMDGREWTYDRDDEEHVVSISIHGDDLVIPLRIRFNTNLQLVTLYSPMEFEIPEDQIVNAAMAIAAINYGIVDGTFDLNVENGRMGYRMATSYRESLLSEEAFNFLIQFALHVVDEYNDKFLMLAKGVLTWQQILEGMKSDD